MANVANNGASAQGSQGRAAQAPTPAMRFVLAVAVAAFALLTAGGFGLFLCLIVCFGMFAGLAIAMQHTGGIADAETFAWAHWIGLSALALFLLGARLYRLRAARPTEMAAVITGSPIGTICIALPLLTLFVVRRAWDTSDFGAAAGAVLVDAFYFYALATVIGVSIALLKATGTAYRWAATSHYRAGLVTGVLAATLLVLGAVGPGASAAPTKDVSSVLWSQTAASASRLGPLEFERSLLRSLDGVLEGKASKPAAPESAPPAVASAQPITQPDSVQACLETLFISDVPAVERSVRAKYRLSDDDAKDLVREALINVCLAHAVKRYDHVAAVLQIAAERRAKSNWRRERYARCAAESEPALCAPNLPEFAHAEQVDRILDAVRCQVTDPTTQNVVYMHVAEGKDFVAIDAELGLERDAARTRWNNFVKRARAVLEKKACAA